jgi:hypothetical protein
MIDFDNTMHLNLSYMDMEFSEQTKESITNYLFHGLKPGGNLEAHFAHDLERALYNADTHNRQVYWAIARWIRDNAPPTSQGTYEAIEYWCKNEEARNKYREECEKSAMWSTLNEQ